MTNLNPSSDILREEEILATLSQSGNLRSLRNISLRGEYLHDNSDGKEYYNLSSNDYLGLADVDIQRRFMEAVDFEGHFVLGNPSSRLMTGNSAAYTQLEQTLATLLGTEATLVLGSGFAVNSGLLPAVTQRGDLILADRLVHASLIDGIRLCDGVEWQRFRHNDMEHLAGLLSKYRGTGRIIVVTESLFSMDGDFAPLGALAELQQQYGFRLYLDEAHAFGVYGTDANGTENGAGLLSAYNAEHPELPLTVEYHVVTFGKALASQGGAIACSEATKQLLINRMRPLIFSTALPDISLEWTRFVIGLLPEFAPRRERLEELIEIVNTILEPTAAYGSQIIPILAGSNENALRMASVLRDEGFWVTAIRHPTVPQGEARLRASLCASHSPDKIKHFASLCRQFG